MNNYTFLLKASPVSHFHQRSRLDGFPHGSQYEQFKKQTMQTSSNQLDKKKYFDNNQMINFFPIDS